MLYIKLYIYIKQIIRFYRMDVSCSWGISIQICRQLTILFSLAIRSLWSELVTDWSEVEVAQLCPTLCRPSSPALKEDSLPAEPQGKPCKWLS